MRRTVHLLIRRDTLDAGMSDYLASRIRATPGIRVHLSSEIVEVFGDERLQQIDVENKVTGERKRLDAAAVFVFIGAEPHANWLPTTVERDALGYLLTGTDAVRSGQWPLSDRDPCPLETTIPRLMAAGDVRAGSTKPRGLCGG